MMNDVVSDPVGTFVRLATDSPRHQRPTSLPEGCFKVAFSDMRKVKFFTKRFQSKAGQKHLEGTLT